MATKESDFVKRDARVDVRAIDKDVKNKFKWNWLDEKDSNDEYFSVWARKLNEPGFAFCLTCKSKINYASNGKKALASHSKKTDHKNARQALKHAQSLPAVMTATKAMENCEDASASVEKALPYGCSPSLFHYFKKSDSSAAEPQVEVQKPEPMKASFQDRKSHQEALICTFIAEHSLPLSVAGPLVSLAKELSKDPKALNEIKLERHAATYKLKFGVHLTIRKRLLNSMRENPFSLNIDESTSKASKKRVLNILVCLFDSASGESFTDHYASVELSTVNADTVFSAVTEQLTADGIPIINLISILTDSASYMRGQNNGLLTKLQELKCEDGSDGSHILDISGDVCHNIHNAVKVFCDIFDKDEVLSKTLDTVAADFNFSADLREELCKMSTALGLPNLLPLDRPNHRWLSIYDATERVKTIFTPLTLFYFSFMSKEDQTLYEPIVCGIFTSVSAEAREKVMDVMRTLRSKSLRLTKAGKERKRKIIERLFYKRTAFQLEMNVILAVMPLFKSFVITFEQKCPMVHKIYDKIMETLKFFLCSFLRIEKVNEKNLHSIDVKDSENCRPLKDIYTGKEARKFLDSMDKADRKTFLSRLMHAYKKCGEYLQKKLPATNTVLKALSSLDPVIQGHSVGEREMQKLIDFFPTVVKVDREKVCQEIMRYHRTDAAKLPTYNETDRLDKWWSKALIQFPALTPLLKASLSIFTGPRVEQSFSMMNNIITKTSNRMAISTYAAYQCVKYHLLNKQKSAVQLLQRNDIDWSPIDKCMAYHIQTSWQRKMNHKKGKAKKRDEKCQQSISKSVHNKCLSQIAEIQEFTSSKKKVLSDTDLLKSSALKRQKH